MLSLTHLYYITSRMKIRLNETLLFSKSIYSVFTGFILTTADNPGRRGHSVMIRLLEVEQTAAQ